MNMEAVIDLQLLDSLVEAMPSKSKRDACHATVRNLQRLSVSDDSSLGEFLSAFATSVADLYAATAVAIWFQVPVASNHTKQQSFRRKVDVGWKNLSLDATTESAHEQLIAFAIRQRTGFAAPPFSAPMTPAKQPAHGERVSNPTDSYLLLVPVRFEHQDVAILEIALGPKPLRRPHEVVMDSYVEWLSWLSRLLQQGIERRFAVAEQPLVAALGTIQQTRVDVEEIQNQIRQHIEQSLARFAGLNFGTLKANQTIAKQVHELLDSKGVRVLCPECGTPAILRCQNAGNSKTGAFTYDHYLESGRTFHGGQTTFPKLKVVSKPPRRSAK